MQSRHFGFWGYSVLILAWTGMMGWLAPEVAYCQIAPESVAVTESTDAEGDEVKTSLTLNSFAKLQQGSPVKFLLPDIHTGKLTSSNSLRGRKVLLINFASW